MTIEQITALLIAIGSMPILNKIIDVWKAHRTGRAQTEKQENRNALGRLVAAEELNERLRQYASTLRELLIEWGYPPDKLPKWPAKESANK